MDKARKSLFFSYHMKGFPKLRISTIKGEDTGVENVGVDACAVEYDAASQTLRCAGLPAGAEVKVINFGGVMVANAMATGGEAVVSLAAQPKSPYIAVIKCGGEVRSHRFIKW